MRRPAILVWAILLAGCGGGGGGGQGSGTPGVPPPNPITLIQPLPPLTGPGTLQLLDIATGTLGAQTLDGSTYDPVATLSGATIAFRSIAGGNVITGSPDGELGHRSNEGLHLSTLNAYSLGSLELTQAQWTALAGAAGFADAAHLQPWNAAAPAAAAGPSGDVATAPATMLSRSLIDAVLTDWNAAHPPHRLRLPSAVEWETACRAGSLSAWSWGGSEAVPTVGPNAVVAETRFADGVLPVGGRLPNAYRLYDMHGNAWEHVADGPEGALRGGSWADNLLAARSACRQYIDRETAHAAAGVRLVLRR